METTNDTTVQAAREFETEVCSRCGGCGEHSYCPMYGTTCFKCQGKRVVLSKRGAAAFKVYEDSLSVPASTLKVGDTIRNTITRKFTKVIAIRETVARGESLKDGVMVPYELPALEIETQTITYANMMPGSMVRKGWSEEDKAAKRTAALDYQDTLTKAGTPRKR